MLEMIDRRLIGTWRYIGPDKERPFGECFLVFTSTRYWLFYDIQKTDEHVYCVNTEYTPHMIDIPGPPFIKGIYLIDGKTLKFCLGSEKSERPKTLQGNVKNGWICECYLKVSDSPN